MSWGWGGVREEAKPKEKDKKVVIISRERVKRWGGLGLGANSVVPKMSRLIDVRLVLTEILYGCLLYNNCPSSDLLSTCQPTIMGSSQARNKGQEFGPTICLLFLFNYFFLSLLLRRFIFSFILSFEISFFFVKNVSFEISLFFFFF